ncbi:unnamed protein product [Hyaloperonospora brassicae]|uniref:CLASP N-terminal domain-containing protein n=1 Tax=Hyaloperonospora brassicae TaxID=162125 RepID=A0AAV0U5W0_HYABA|nr:unnamed protein product [Hyaloperonospora brassicae]
MVAKENLDHIASTVDSSTLAARMISMLGDGSNMKVKAAMCHYLRELLPRAEGYMKNGINNSHMSLWRPSLSGCAALRARVDVALGLLPPSKRSVVAKVLKSKKIVLTCNYPENHSASSTAPHKTRPPNGDNNNNRVVEKIARKPERSRKRPESPSVDSSGSAQQNDQKRMNMTSQSISEDLMNNRIAGQSNEDVVTAVASPRSVVSSSVLFPCGGVALDKHGTQLEDILYTFEENNMSEAEVMRALYRTRHVIETTSCGTWDRCFGRLLLLLLDAATDKNTRALEVLQKLVAAQPSRAQMFSELLFQRLIDATVDQTGVACHLIKRILDDLVRSASDQQQILALLMPLVSSSKPPVLPMVLRLTKLCFQHCEQSSREKDVTFLRNDDVVDRLTKCIGHSNSSVRKCAVDCLVALHFAVMEDSRFVPTYLAANVDATQQRLVEIFIDRAKMTRHPSC